MQQSTSLGLFFDTLDMLYKLQLHTLTHSANEIIEVFIEPSSSNDVQPEEWHVPTVTQLSCMMLKVLTVQ